MAISGLTFSPANHIWPRTFFVLFETFYSFCCQGFVANFLQAGVEPQKTQFVIGKHDLLIKVPFSIYAVDFIFSVV